MSDQLRSIFARWLSLELAKAQTSDDLKELFAEAKGNGYDTKALRVAFRTHVKDGEPESDADRATRALVETYLTDLAEKPLARPARARVEKIEEFRPAAPVKAAAEESGAAGINASPSHEEDGAHRKVSLDGGSRHDSWQMDEDIPANLDRRIPVGAN